MESIIQQLRNKRDESIKLLKQFVEVESFSHDKEGVDQLGKLLTNVFERFPVKIHRFKNKTYGDHLRIQYGTGNKQILLISHLDTVYPRGTLNDMPFKVKGDRIMGPGVIDIKASYVMVYHLFDFLSEEELNNYQIVWLLTSDEEIGSPSGKFVVAEEAKKSEFVLVLEPATNTGELKTSRKGGGKFTVEVAGIAAHAGLNPEDGANAIEELAYQIMKITALADNGKGTTINTGEIKGGHLFNVVPDYASAEIDIRVSEMTERERIEQAFRQLSVKNKKTVLKVTGSVYRPPLLRTEQTNELFALAQRVGQSMNLELKGATVGGGSDGNYAAETGTPVLDGLGPYGGFAHSPNEFLWIDTIAERTTLVYFLIQKLTKKGY